MDNILFYTIDRSEMGRIKPLWEGLNRHHESISVYFKEHYQHFTFEKRVVKFNNPDIIVHLMVAEDTLSKKLIGYCLSSIDVDNTGEIDSLFVDDAYRGKKIGEYLINDAREWLKNNNVEKISLSVVYNNSRAAHFYEKLGFFPSSTVYVLKSKTE